jgi:hypothetical protein
MSSMTLETKGAQMDHKDVVPVPLVNFGRRGWGAQVDQEDDAQMPLTILAARKAERDPKNDSNAPCNFGFEGVTVDQEGDAVVPLATSGVRPTQMDHGDGAAVLLLALSAPGAQGDLGKVSAVLPADGITKAMPVNHGTASAVSFKANGS